MRRARWIIKPEPETTKPMIYHCVSRVVNREFVFQSTEKEQLRMFMRMYEGFSGNRVLSYCFMSNHIHLLLEVTPAPADGLTDEELLRRLRAIHSEAQVAVVAEELETARKAVAEGVSDGSCVAEIHARFTYRMHDLSQFMKSFMQRYTRWHNGAHQRKGRLWEDRFKSVIVEDGVACRMMAAYIDLNPVRAGMVKDPADYRWSSYGEAMGGGPRGNGKKARAGLVRALMAHKGWEADARHWTGRVSKEYRMVLLEEGEEKLREVVNKGGELEVKVVRKGLKKAAVDAEMERLQRHRDVAMSRMLRCRVRYFTDGAVIGSRGFVDEVFRLCRDRFGGKRKDGARKWRGSGAAAAGTLWSVRDLKKGIG
jgi:REP element-mobilizing transposase RayT